MANYDMNGQSTANQNYDEEGHTSANRFYNIVRTVVNHPVQPDGLSNEYVQDVQRSNSFSDSNVLQNEKNQPKEYTTPQALWNKRRSVVNTHHTIMRTVVNYPVEPNVLSNEYVQDAQVVNYPAELSGLSNEYVLDAQGSNGFSDSDVLQNEKNQPMECTTPQALWRKRHSIVNTHHTLTRTIVNSSAEPNGSSKYHVEEAQVVNYPVELNGLSNEYVQDAQGSKGFHNSDMLQNEPMECTTPQALWRKRHSIVNTHHTLTRTIVNYPVEPNGLCNSHMQDAQGSKGFADSDVLQNEKTKSTDATPQALWKKRREAYHQAHSVGKGSPSRYTSFYKARMPISPSASAVKELRGSADARAAWLMNARKIRLETAPSAQRSHLRSLSQCNERNKTEEFKGILQRPRRSLDSAAGTGSKFQERMCLSPQNIGFSFSSPKASCSSCPSPDSWDQPEAQNVSNFEVQPKFKSYQLLGDSLFVRFAEQLLHIPCGIVEGNRGIGLCVSGQKSGELLRRVSQRMYPVTERIVLLIGTNDVLQNVHKVEMCYTLERLLELLKMSVSKIVLLTLPPIPKLHGRREHRKKIQEYNEHIRTLEDDVVSVADIHHLYLTERETCKMEMFERFYGDGPKLDLIHLNRRGLQEIRKFLLQNNFVN